MRSPAAVALALLLVPCADGERRPAKPPLAVTRVMRVSVAADDRTLTVEYVGGACDDPAGVEAEESPDRVRLVARVQPDGSTGCLKIGYVELATLTLRAPLGTRTVVDALDGKKPEVRRQPA